MRALEENPLDRIPELNVLNESRTPERSLEAFGAFAPGPTADV